MKKTILITGTHLTPALELIRQLQEDNKTKWDIHYIGRKFNSSVDTKKSIESDIIPKTGSNFYQISCGKFDRRWLPNTIKGIPHIFHGFKEAKELINTIKPDVVVSFGGYVSVPVIFIASKRKIPTITHEQTFTTSLSTKINSVFCKKVALSFPKEKLSSKEVVTGNLLRQDIFKDNSKLFKKLLFTKNNPIIFITAGNQGSKVINDHILRIHSQLSNYSIIHQTGESDFNRCHQFSVDKNNYHTFSYINSHDIGWVYKNAKIIISRAGANTCQEIALFNKRTILIPLPSSQQNEQNLNANWVKKIHPLKTIIINQNELTPQILINKINHLSKLKSIRTRVNTVPNFKLLELIYEII